MGEATSPTQNAPDARAFRLESGARRNFPMAPGSIAHSLTGVL